MVLSIYDIEDFGFYFEIQPLKKLLDTSLSTAKQQELQYYDYVLRGNKLRLGREFLDNEALCPVCELDVRGKLRCFEMFMVSDQKFKDNIALLDPSVCSTTLRDTDVYTYNFKGKPDTKIGFIAQQLQGASPGLVAEDQQGLTVDYNQMMAVVVGALKDIDKRLQGVEDELAALRAPACPSSAANDCTSNAAQQQAATMQAGGVPHACTHSTCS